MRGHPESFVSWEFGRGMVHVVQLWQRFHARIQKVLWEGSNFDNVFFFVLFDKRQEKSKYHYTQDIIGPPANAI